MKKYLKKLNKLIKLMEEENIVFKSDKYCNADPEFQVIIGTNKNIFGIHYPIPGAFHFTADDFKELKEKLKAERR